MSACPNPSTQSPHASQHVFTLELGCEELPPKALDRLTESLKSHLELTLSKHAVTYDTFIVYGAPRRLALKIEGLPESQPDSQLQRKGPSQDLCFDHDGKPTPALTGFLKSLQATQDDLEWIETPKGLCAQITQCISGQPLKSLLPGWIQSAFEQLPIPKAMRWGSGNLSFTRPTRWLLALWDNEVLPMTLLGHTADRLSYGHRVHAHNPLILSHAGEYPNVLEEHGFVIPSADERRQRILQQIQTLTTPLHAHAVVSPELLQEVSQIVEWPVAVLCQFEEAFLEVPQEALMASMQQHQKSFPVQDASGKLLPYFITVANLQSQDSTLIREGNQKVMRARLSDARFFYQEDLKHPLESHLAALDTVTFQAGLGTLGDKTLRLEKLARWIASHTTHNPDLAARAAHLSKCDLMTHMVMEFPELQGIMGRAYARRQDPESVAIALSDQYEAQPASALGQILALADHIDNLVALFGVDQKPTGSKDPFALRRSAIRIMGLLTQDNMAAISFKDLILKAIEGLSGKLTNREVESEVSAFILERMLQDLKSRAPDSVGPFEAAIATPFTSLWEISQRVTAFEHFRQRPEAHALIQAHKRVSHLLQKQAAEAPEIRSECIDPDFFSAEDAHLWAQLTRVKEALDAQASRSPLLTLETLCQLHSAVEAFFENTMILVDDLEVRANRLALLRALNTLLNLVGDLGKLS